jgi:hypothetical protein
MSHLCAEVIAGGLLLFSGADRDRTGDPLVANQVLSQLSYRPEDAPKLTARRLPTKRTYHVKNQSPGYSPGLLTRLHQ